MLEFNDVFHWEDNSKGGQQGWNNYAVLKKYKKKLSVKLDFNEKRQRFDTLWVYCKGVKWPVLGYDLVEGSKEPLFTLQKAWHAYWGMNHAKDKLNALFGFGDDNDSVMYGDMRGDEVLISVEIDKTLGNQGALMQKPKVMIHPYQVDIELTGGSWNKDTVFEHFGLDLDKITDEQIRHIYDNEPDGKDGQEDFCILETYAPNMSEGFEIDAVITQNGKRITCANWNPRDLRNHGKTFTSDEEVVTWLRTQGDETYNSVGDDFLLDEAIMHEWVCSPDEWVEQQIAFQDRFNAVTNDTE